MYRLLNLARQEVTSAESAQLCISVEKGSHCLRLTDETDAPPAQGPPREAHELLVD